MKATLNVIARIAAAYVPGRLISGALILRHSLRLAPGATLRLDALFFRRTIHVTTGATRTGLAAAA